MRDLRKGGATALGAFVTVALAAALSVIAGSPAQAGPPKRDIALILDYSVAYACPVYANYPKEGVSLEQAWSIAPGDTVAWRYNVNDNWALISDKKYRGSHTHAWWGFTPRVCIGTSLGTEHFPTPDSSYPAGVAIPNRILEGRSAVEADHYRSVDIRPAAGHVVNDHKKIKTKGTLRDARGRFVIGNVFPGWYVAQTDEHDGPWTKVYVYGAKRWGWVANEHL